MVLQTTELFVTLIKPDIPIHYTFQIQDAILNKRIIFECDTNFTFILLLYIQLYFSHLSQVIF